LSQAGEKAAADQAFAAAGAAKPDDAKLHDALGKAHLQIGRIDAAVRYFEKAVELSPEDLTYRFDLALAHEKAGAPAAAIGHYESALSKHPESLDAKNNLAWILATCPDDAVRDGARALALAKAVNEATGNANPATLDTLAAAQAEGGDFESAAATLDRAIPLARARGQQAVVANLREKRSLYLSGEPYRSGE
jgi:tetratricopeptide (TPR) repeat protein